MPYADYKTAADQIPGSDFLALNADSSAYTTAKLSSWTFLSSSLSSLIAKNAELLV